jgi:hypothetical protein
VTVRKFIGLGVALLVFGFAFWWWACWIMDGWREFDWRQGPMQFTTFFVWFACFIASIVCFIKAGHEGRRW